MASLRRFLRPRQALTTAALAAPALLSVASVRNEEVNSNEPQSVSEAASGSNPHGEPSLGFIGVFVSTSASKKMKSEFPSAITERANSEPPLFAVLKFNPTEKEKAAFAPLLGSSAKVQVLAVVEDEETQAAIVKITNETGDPIEYESGAERAHVLISSTSGVDGLNMGRANVLLERLRANKKLDQLLQQVEESKPESPLVWDGELPEFDSQHFPLYNPFPATRVQVKALTKPMELEGTVCQSSSYDYENGVCTSVPAKPECGFCKFMKAGPCGQEFTAWEACLDRCKSNGDDFIEKCGAETLALRDCVDANPEYYHVLNESPEEAQAEAEGAGDNTGAQADN